MAARQHHNDKRITLRHLWLASLGSVAIARREAANGMAKASDRFGALRRQAISTACDAQLVARGGLMTLRERLQARMQQATTRKPMRRTPRKARA